MKKIAATIIFVSLFAVLGISQTGLRVGSSAPLFSAPAMDGTQLDMNELRGSVVVLTFWSTKCYICQQEFPKMNQVVRSYDGKKVVFLSLTMENETKVESFLRSNRIAAQVVPNSFGVLLQYADRDKRGYIDMGFPSYFVVDQQGVLQHRASGWDKTGQLSSTINNLIR
jgi:peroxiredoxin